MAAPMVPNLSAPTAIVLIDPTTGLPYSAVGVTFANPSANIGMAAINGVAATAMRSDAAPAIDPAIAPTWTGVHIFAATGGLGVRIQATNNTNAASFEGGAVDGINVRFYDGAVARGYLGYGDSTITGAVISDFCLAPGAAGKIKFGTPGGAAEILSLSAVAAVGAQSATFVATNKPGTGTAGPTNWLPVTVGATTYYIPMFGA